MPLDRESDTSEASLTPQIRGAPDTPYAGGEVRAPFVVELTKQYHGVLTFPPEYPFAPPSVRAHSHHAS